MNREKLLRYVSEEVSNKLVKNQLRTLLILKENPALTKKQLSKILGIITTAVDKNIAKLKSLGLLMRIGPDKDGYWEVLE